MSNILEMDAVLSIAVTTFAGLTCAVALEATGTSLVAYKISFIAGVVFGIIVELAQQEFLYNYKASDFVGNIFYCFRAIITGVAVDEYQTKILFLKSWNIFEASQRSHAQAIAFSSGFLAVQFVAQIIVGVKNIVASSPQVYY